MSPRPLLLRLIAGLAAALPALLPAAEVSLKRADDRIRVEVGGKLFTEYVFKGGPKPYFYPVLAADGTELTRNFPMKKGVPGEVEDHPHHRSLWFTHGDVNGIDFWAEGDARKGRIVSDSVEQSVAGGTGVIAVHLTDETVVRISASGDSRFLDYQVTLKAPAGKPAVFGDTKEGSMAIRVPLWMTPPHSYSANKQRVKHAGTGTIINAEGVKNTAAWGKRSTWVDYHGPKDGKVYGVAIFDHPSNPRHPTWWHVRDYALFAANPFGKHDFENLKDQPKAGEMTVPAGGSVTFRWRFYFHAGDEKAAKVAEQFRAFADSK